MLPSRRLYLALAGALVCAFLSLLAAGASAAPITVQLRIEGSAATLFEGPVATDAIANPPGISTPSSAGPHPCDVKDDGANGGFGPSAATPSTALYDAAATAGLAFDASWSSELNDFFVKRVGPDENSGAPEFPSWGYAVNYTTAGVGGCQFQLAPGSEVLWAYNYFNLGHLLSLTGPAVAGTGVPFTVHVSDGQTGEPISGAAIGAVNGGVTATGSTGAVTDAAGNASVSLAQAGTLTLKATRADSVRSNGLAVCVHAGADGSCGTSATAPTGAGPASAPAAGAAAEPLAEVAEILGIKDGHVYPRRLAPRVLRGRVALAPGDTLRQVRIRLQRRWRGRCFGFSGARLRFVRVRRCTPAAYFAVGAAESFSYLLPEPLPPGRYAYDIQALDGAKRSSKLVNGVSHVVFRVR